MAAVGYIQKVVCLDANGNAIDPRDPHIQPACIDVYCQKTADDDNLLTSQTDGCEWVQIDVTDTRGGYPKIGKLSTSGVRPYGVVLPNQGTIGNGDPCWVRWKGVHLYAAVDGTTDVAAGDPLAAHGSTAGAAIKQGTATQVGSIAQALAARTTNSISALSVFIRPTHVM